MSSIRSYTSPPSTHSLPYSARIEVNEKNGEWYQYTVIVECGGVKVFECTDSTIETDNKKVWMGLCENHAEVQWKFETDGSVLANDFLVNRFPPSLAEWLIANLIDIVAES